MSNPSDTSLPPSTRSLLLGFWSHLSLRRRIQLGLLLVVMFASGGAELLSLGAVLPLLAMLSNPEQLWQEPLVHEIAARMAFTEASQLLLPVTLAFAGAAILAALIRLTNLWLIERLTASVGSDFSCQAYQRTLYQPYGVHVQLNSAAVIAGATSQITGTVGVLTALLQLMTAAVVASALLAGLLLIDWPVALGVAMLFGSVYGLLAITTKKKLQRNSQLISSAARLQIKLLQEGLGAIRDVLLDGSQNTYVEIYRQADIPQRQLQAENQFLGMFPRFALEALGMVSIALVGGLHQLNGVASSTIPLLGVLALGAQRLLPALQQIYSGWASLKAANATMEAVLALLNQPLPPKLNVSKALQFRESIRLDGVHFRYGQKQPEVLRGLDLELRRGERIGLIGSTGSGKTTTVDLLMGLLVPSVGRVLVDGVDLHDPEHSERLTAWRAAIAHVPQSIFLADSSIAENIAFGVPSHEIDLARVKQAAFQAQIASFIEASPNGYNSFVGERGIRLSGGQRQRIAIARALYKNASVMVFDEATSALDTLTEEAVMSAVEGLSKELTIVIIAHRLSTVRHCDRVIKIANGIVSVDGPPDHVLTVNHSV